MYKIGESVCSTFKKTNAHNGVKKLQFSGNPVSKWHEICRLGRVFPNLQSLVLAECPLKAVEPIPRPGSSSSESSSDNASSNSESEDPPHQYFQCVKLFHNFYRNFQFIPLEILINSSCCNFQKTDVLKFKQHSNQHMGRYRSFGKIPGAAEFACAKLAIMG